MFPCELPLDYWKAICPTTRVCIVLILIVGDTFVIHSCKANLGKKSFTGTQEMCSDLGCL